jgi:N-methylhydantoinase B
VSDRLDAARYEIFRHRLFHILEEGRIAMRRVSGSAVTVEGGENMCSLHAPDGDPILVAAGILLHCVGARDFIIKANEWYADDPGFFDGDQLFFNDPYIGGQHLVDMVVIKPIFYQDELIAWTGSIVHTPETGGMDPGGQSASATEAFHEGIKIHGLKIVERGKLRPEVYRTIVEQTRDPHLVGLDAKARIAANNVVARRYLELVERFGLEFVREASDRVIRDSELHARERLSGLPDGIWRSRLYGDTGGIREEPYKVECTMTKIGDKVTFDFTGSSPENYGSNNTTYPACWSTLFVVLASQLFWNVYWNGGMFKPVKLIAPEGTVVNCRYPAAVSCGVHSTATLIQETAHECIAKMLFAAGLPEDVNSGWPAAGGAPFFGGVNAAGDQVAGVILDDFGSGLGAAPFRDGVSTGGAMQNPTSSISDIEVTELNLPFLCLGRRQATDSLGYGRWSGGMAPEVGYMVYRARQMRLGLLGIGRRTPAGYGMFGGYPPALAEAYQGRDTDLPERLAAGEIPQSFDEVLELKGEVRSIPLTAPALPVEDYDFIYWRLWGGGGYGDPLDREPERVVDDVRTGSISAPAARLVFGVALDPESGELDEAETDALRERIRDERLREGVPARTLLQAQSQEQVAARPASVGAD